MRKWGEGVAVRGTVSVTEVNCWKVSGPESSEAVPTDSSGEGGCTGRHTNSVVPPVVACLHLS
jgi:hypothetical protein